MEIQQVIDFVVEHWGKISAVVAAVGAVAGAGAKVVSLYKAFKSRVKKYRGPLDSKFADFLFENRNAVLDLELVLDEEQSRQLVDWQLGENPGATTFFSVKADDAGTEIGFFHNDPEIHWNMRFRSDVHTEGFFKVHSIEGPWQGWMAVTLRGVGKEHVKDK